jgi:hypothetical protein
MQVLRYRCHRVPKTHSIITDDIELQPYNATYSQVVPRHRSSLERKGRNKEEDEVLARFSDTIRVLTNRNWETYVNTEQYHRLLAGDIATLAFHSVLTPKIFDGFGSVFMAGANFEDTAIFQLWSGPHVFERDDEFANGLRFREHQNGSLITIYYGIDSGWSKKTADKMTEEHDGRNIRERLIDGTKELFRDEQFLWQANKSLDGNPFGDNAIRLPNRPHGLNNYSEIHNISFLSALNPTTDHFKFLEMKGLSGNDVRRAIYFQAAYQSIMRTSIRNPEDRHPKRIIVPDRHAAEYLQSKFPGSRIEQLNIGIGAIGTKRIGRPRKHASNAARVAAQRQKTQDSKLRILREQMSLQIRQDPMGECWGNGSNTRAKTTIDSSYTHLSTAVHSSSNWIEHVFQHDFHSQPCVGTLYPDKKQSMPLAYVSCPDHERFIYVLWFFHNQQFDAKEKNNLLISPAIFDPSLCENHDRARENIKYMQNRWLDFEKGDLPPDELPNLFPNLRMVISNTYSHTADNPRFRVMIPTATSLTPEAYELLYNQIAWKLEDAGYGLKEKDTGKPRSGLDWSKSAPTSLFYLPCQAKDPNQSFFIDYDGPERFPLDAVAWIENAPIPLQPESPDCSEPWADGKEIDQLRVQRAQAEWRNAPKGMGNDGFFRLGLECKRAGMNLGQIETLLHTEVLFARSRNDRKAQIPSILASLQKRQRLTV